MRGTVLGFDARSGEGKISGDDGARYAFLRTEWHGKTPPAANQLVDFEVSGGDALAIYPMRGAANYDRSRVASALLAIFTGSIGIHKFYMGKTGAGLTMLIISVVGLVFAGVPTAIMHAIAVIEGFIYLLMSDDRFDRTRVNGPKAWF